MNDIIVDLNLRLKDKIAELKEVEDKIKMLEDFNRQKSRERDGRRGSGRARRSHNRADSEDDETDEDDYEEVRKPKPRRRTNPNNTNTNPFQLQPVSRDQMMMNNLTRMILGRR